VLVWLVNGEGGYKEFLTRGVWYGGFLPPHSWMHLCFYMYVFSNIVYLFASLVYKCHTESYSLWDVEFTIDAFSLFALCYPESQFLPATKLVSLQQQLADICRFVFAFLGPLLLSCARTSGSPVKVTIYFLQWSGCSFLIM